MRNISFRLPTNKRDVKVLWKEYTSKRYRTNVEVMRKMTEFYINNVLRGRWDEVSKGQVVKWNDDDKKQFEREMRQTCNEYIHDLME